MIFPTALRLAAEVGRLRRQVRELTYELTHSQQERERLLVSLKRLAMNVDLVACMARDQRVAAEFVRDARRIADLPEVEETN